jgi:hypothetical protein
MSIISNKFYDLMLISRTNSFQKMLMQQIPSSCWDYPETFAVDDEGT